MWKGTLSPFLFKPSGLFEPVWCRNRRCTAARAKTTKGSRKWKAKNRFRVALSTANPPQIHSTNIGPIYGMADSRFVITVAPQNLICPQGRTYPTKAAAIVAIKIIIPIFHTSRYMNEP